VRRESPPIIKGEQPIDTANLEANKAAWASPIKASIYRGQLHSIDYQNFFRVISENCGNNCKSRTNGHIKVDFKRI
jgi:hypothetical protein